MHLLRFSMETKLIFQWPLFKNPLLPFSSLKGHMYVYAQIRGHILKPNQSFKVRKRIQLGFLSGEIFSQLNDSAILLAQHDDDFWLHSLVAFFVALDFFRHSVLPKIQPTFLCVKPERILYTLRHFLNIISLSHMSQQE